MLFNSTEFLFVFLPIVLLGFTVLQKMGRLTPILLWLVVCSLFFYAWWNPVYLLLLVFSGCVNYTLGGLLNRANGERGRAVLVAGILFNLGLLAYFKYADFFIDNVRILIDWSFHTEKIILPLAISFYTFQQITYLVDAAKKKTKPHGPLKYALFVSFFPQLIAGPIVHHSEMLSQFDKLTDSSERSRNFTVGISILIIGLFKKVVIADGFAQFSTPIFSLASAGQELFTMDAIAGIFSYAFQLYFDFSGYSDMAIGLACLFGIKLPVNFFSPYRALNISDFWRMWHATLGRFLRDYVYGGLGGFMCSPTRQRFNLFMTMFLGGVWHGAGWTFFVYGIMHGAAVVIHQLWRIKVSGPLGLVGRRDYQTCALVFTFLCVTLALVVFRADSLTSAAAIYQALGQWNGVAYTPEYASAINASNTLTLTTMLFGAPHAVPVISALLFAAMAACWFLPSTYQLFKACAVTIDKPAAGRAPVMDIQWRESPKWAVYTGVLAALSIIHLSEVSEFLYFQF